VTGYKNKQLLLTVANLDIFICQTATRLRTNVTRFRLLYVLPDVAKLSFASSLSC
jgi:hypothetical protein